MTYDSLQKFTVVVVEREHRDRFGDHVLHDKIVVNAQYHGITSISVGQSGSLEMQDETGNMIAVAPGMWHSYCTSNRQDLS